MGSRGALFNYFERSPRVGGGDCAADRFGGFMGRLGGLLHQQPIYRLPIRRNAGGSSLYVRPDNRFPQRIAGFVQVQRIGAKELRARPSARIEHGCEHVNELEIFTLGNKLLN